MRPAVFHVQQGMYKVTLLAAACGFFGLGHLSANFDHSILDDILSDHVMNGLVDYGALKRDDQLDRYLEKLATADLSKIGQSNEELAFWINAYNAYTLKLVAESYPVKSIKLIDTFGGVAESIKEAKPWSIRFATVAGTEYTLDEIEHEILRKKFQDPRIHLAIVCAAQSCPLLRDEAYVASKLDAQLDSQGRWFFGWRNQFDLGKKEARLSRILDWFAEDFGDSQAELLGFASKFVQEDIAKSLIDEPYEWKVSYQVYDWKLNAKK